MLDRVIHRIEAEGCPTAAHCRSGLIVREEQRQDENEMGKPSSRPLYLSVYQYHLSSVMPLPPLMPRLVLNPLFIQTFPYRQTNLGSASAS